MTGPRSWIKVAWIKVPWSKVAWLKVPWQWASQRAWRPRAGKLAPNRRPKARLVGALVASVLGVGVLLVVVFPTRSYLAQRASINKAQQRLDALDREHRRLTAESRRLSTPTEIERLARAQYGLVRRGEQAYVIVPAPKPPLGLPELWPFAGLEHLLNTR
ncbi:MAG: septum formation initiator family protein [Actinomycetota bacterium]|nr:septum formation initiator family protein [Actinomycetota bacterium]